MDQETVKTWMLLGALVLSSVAMFFLGRQSMLAKAERLEREYNWRLRALHVTMGVHLVPDGDRDPEPPGAAAWYVPAPIQEVDDMDFPYLGGDSVHDPHLQRRFNIVKRQAENDPDYGRHNREERKAA